MLSQKQLNLIEKGEKIDHFLLVRKCELRLTKSNKQYLYLELGDKNLTVSANMWDNFESVSNLITTGEVVKVAGTMDDFQSTPQIRILSIRKSKPSDKVSPDEFLPKSKRDLEEMKNEFTDRIEKISNSYLKALMKRIFSGENFQKFITSPAGKSWHHSYIHGLLEHTLEIIKICDLMCDIHPEINRNLLICGAMLHDFGKTEEISPTGAFEYTDSGKLIGHIVIAAMLVNEELKKVPDFPEDLKKLLLHLILSHQGKLEFASPVVPKTLEAITLYQADELSAKVNAYKNALTTGAASEGKWTKFIQLAATDLYNHGLASEFDDPLKKTLFD